MESQRRKKSGLLSLVLPKTFILSSKSINPAEMLSAGNKGVGLGVSPPTGESRERYCMNNIFWKRSDLQQNRTEKIEIWITEIEYMISGKVAMKKI